MAPGRRSALLRYFVAVVTVAAFLLLRRLLTPVVGDQSPYVILLGATMLSAWYGGFGPGVLAVLLSAISADYFFIHPLYAFLGNGVLHDSRLVLFVVEGLFVSWLTENLHVARHKHEESERSLAEADVRKDEFLAILGHEMRNPLATIRHAIAILRDPRATPVQSNRARDTLDRQAEYLTRIIDDILDVSRITRGKLVMTKGRFDLREVVARAIEQCRTAIDQRRHEFLYSIPLDGVYVDGDLVRLVQIVSNLLTNACKYTDEGGRIKLKLAREGDEATISVRDNGIGISPDMLPRIFMPFAQSDRAMSRAQGGLGLGLTVVRSLVERHGGTVMVVSAGAGQGSEFIVRLPLAKSNEARNPGTRRGIRRRSREDQTLAALEGLARNSEKPPTPPVRALRVLVVDDNEDIATALSTLLRLSGHDTRCAGNGRIATEMARAFKPHVVLLDLQLPDAHGCDIARQLRSEFSDRPLLLLALTGEAGDNVRRRCQEAGFDEYLLKPVRHTDLAERLSRFAAEEVEGKSNSNPSISIVVANN